MKYTATLSAVQVGQAVKSLLLLGERKITIEETEKDRFVVTTTTETALSKKSTNSISRKGVKNNYIKDLIDDINWQTSVTSDVLRDVAKFIYILRNYGGQDLAEFLKDLKEHMAIKVTSDGGVDKLQADLNIDAVMAFLDKQRRDLFDFAAAVDTKDPDLGNASGTAINFRYMDLDADCDSMGTELKDTFRRLKLFIDVYFQITGQGDFTNEEFDIVFNMDLPVNETDIINNAVNSNGLLSKRTILQNHPWVTDVDEELARIDEEKKAAMEEYGDGLFNHAMGADDSQEGGDSAGLNGGDGNDE